MISYFEEQLSVIDSSFQSLDESVFDQWIYEAANTIESGHKIIVSGLGKNVPICEKFVGSMVSLGMDACYLNTNTAMHGDLGVVRNGDMVILLSKSGETSESIDLTELLLERKTNLWLITFEKDSVLSKKIKKSIILELPHEGDPWNIIPNNSTTVNLILLQGLAMQLVQIRNISLDDFKRNHPGGHIGIILKEKNL